MYFLSKNTPNILLMESYKCSHRRCYFTPQQRLGVALLFRKICSFINEITLSVGSCIRKANKIMREKKSLAPGSGILEKKHCCIGAGAVHG